MTKRGIGLGEKTEYHTEGRDVVTNLYAIHDLDPAETERHYDRRFDSQDDRFRLKLYWREDVTSQLTPGRMMRPAELSVEPARYGK